MRFSRPAAALAAVALSITMLAGCGASAPAAQSDEEACKIVDESLKTLQEDFSGVSSTDIDAAKKAYKDLEAKLTETIGKLNNDTVSEPLTTTRDAVAVISEKIQGATDVASLATDTEVTEATSKLVEGFGGLATACPDASFLTQ